MLSRRPPTSWGLTAPGLQLANPMAMASIEPGRVISTLPAQSEQID